MSTRSLNKVQIIGNLTRDPELRYTPQGTAVASFGVATNREWVSSDGQKKEAAEFHNIVSWNKLAELCAQLLAKGSKVYLEGRLQTRDWVNDTGEKRYKTEIVVDEMILLGNGRDSSSTSSQPKESEESEDSTETQDNMPDLDDILEGTSFDDDSDDSSDSDEEE